MNALESIIKIQRYFRKHLDKQRIYPLSLTVIKLYLSRSYIKLKTQSNDGRINSALDENTVYKILRKNKLLKQIIKKSRKRCWFDILVKDIQFGLIPVNIKITTTNTSDNVGNLSLILYSLTNYEMSFKKCYNNGISAKILIEKLKNKEFNNTERAWDTRCSLINDYFKYSRCFDYLKLKIKMIFYRKF
jgi:hypothetical protein